MNTKKPFSFIIVSFILICIIWSILIPPFEAPDESGHYGYVSFILNNSSLPKPPYSWNEGGSLYQPPLYYLMLSPILKTFGKLNYDNGLRPNPKWVENRFQVANAFIGSFKESIFSKNSNIRVVYLLRFVSILLATVTVFFTFKLASLIFLKHKNLVIFSTLLVAFNPQFIFHSSAITNDNLAILLTTLAIFLMVKTIKGVKINPKTALALGLVVGLAIITKLNLLFLVVVIFIFLLMLYREKYLQILKTGFLY